MGDPSRRARRRFGHKGHKGCGRRWGRLWRPSVERARANKSRLLQWRLVGTSWFHARAACEAGRPIDGPSCPSCPSWLKRLCVRRPAVARPRLAADRTGPRHVSRQPLASLNVDNGSQCVETTFRFRLPERQADMQRRLVCAAIGVPFSLLSVVPVFGQGAQPPQVRIETVYPRHVERGRTTVINVAIPSRDRSRLPRSHLQRV